MFRKLSIKTKLILQTVVPALTIIALALILITSKFSEVDTLNDTKKVSQLLSGISKFIHETQKERGMSAGYLGSSGSRFKDKLPDVS